MPWSYSEDRRILCGFTEGMNRSEDTIKIRKKKLIKTTTLEKLFEEELFIIKNFSKLSTRQIGEKIGLSSTAVSRRFEAMKREGLLLYDKRKVYVTTEKNINIEPMPREMKVITPEGSLVRKMVQEDKLEVDKMYNILTLQKGDRKTFFSKKTKMQLKECYPNHYLFEDETGRKHSLSKINLAIGEWSYEEVR